MKSDSEARRSNRAGKLGARASITLKIGFYPAVDFVCLSVSTYLAWVFLPKTELMLDHRIQLSMACHSFSNLNIYPKYEIFVRSFF